jgi:hypothetical protein
VRDEENYKRRKKGMRIMEGEMGFEVHRNMGGWS